MACGLVLFWMAAGSAADRTRCYLPAPTGAADTDRDTFADAAIRQAGALPTESLGIDASSMGGDADWARYMALWKAHSSEPGSVAVRRWLGLPLEEEVQVSARKGRTSPRFLRWRAASFAVVQTPHFEILTRASEVDSRQIARDLERIYWVWTQLYFPLWVGRDAAAVSLSDWSPEATTADEFLSQRARSRLSLRQRHRVVLLPDERAYQQTVSQRQISAASSSTIAASTGFYSDSLATSFFYPQADQSSIAHEVCHQLFEEATDRTRAGATTATTDAFWLVEGIAGHFESLRYGQHLASIGGWDSKRLQYARYQSLIARQPTAPIAELQGDRTEIQQRADLSLWYSQAILRTHYALDSDPGSAQRAMIIDQLAEIYGVDVADFASLNHPHSEKDDRVDRFLLVRDDDLVAAPITGSATAICLAACEITERGWDALPPLPQVRWFDASRTKIAGPSVERLISDAAQLDQLSLEATQITPAIGSLIAGATELRELDLSWTAIDDSVVASLQHCPRLETVWLTGTPISDEALETLAALPNLKILDVQRTQISDAGIRRLEDSRPQVRINPLNLPDSSESSGAGEQ
ncbi:leucine-rich repeat domain-containing protein [Allorhodopirellula solitaria]|uniref:Leucine Rich repeats (2 copies) n=1 Tax=Allorhodopirellula solitaria TaxID=2527987 RepID=A0A5C5YKE1_9BACT|nr:hypothetical protein [Allorhodopirellula solitaria]TWT75332.1 Leucine Rich repeats (2 copies) [Allorhodopirellula solitaria]